MTKTSVAHLRRTLTPGTRLRIVNHVRPQASRDTVVTAKTNTVDLVTYAENSDGELVESHTVWPRAAELTGDPDDPNTFHIGQHYHGRNKGGPVVPFLIVTVIPDDHPDAADWPATYRLTNA